MVSKDTTALKVDYKSPLNISERQVMTAIERMEQKTMPHDPDMEMAVLGAILLTNVEHEDEWGMVADIVKSIKMLRVKDFYEERNQPVILAVKNLLENHQKMDLLTVTHELKRLGKLNEVTPHYLVELTNRVGSSAHILAHTKIIIELSLRREAIQRNYLANARLFDPASDVFETRNELADDLRVMPVTSFLRARTANQRTEDGANAPRLLQLAGSLWKMGELVFLFAGPKRGKSIFAVQIADALSKGEDLFGGLLPNECDPLRVGYIDFELQDNEWFDRYSEEKMNLRHEFSDNFIIIDQNPDFTQYDSGLDRVIFQSIEDAVLSYKLDAIIIDNITWLAQVATSDTQAALDLMRRLDNLKKRMGISILILAHSPKINAVLPLDENMMGGSKHLSNFAQGVFAIGKSAIDSNVRYIKECVRRSGQVHFDDENVIQVSIEKKDGMLTYEYMRNTAESLHLSDPNDADTKLDILNEAVQMRKNSPKSFGEMYRELGIKDSLGWSKRHFTRKVQEELERLNTNVMFKNDPKTDEKAPFQAPANVQVKPTKKNDDEDIPF